MKTLSLRYASFVWEKKNLTLQLSGTPKLFEKRGHAVLRVAKQIYRVEYTSVKFTELTPLIVQQGEGGEDSAGYFVSYRSSRLKIQQNVRQRFWNSPNWNSPP